jgi:hypothetical protein
MIIPQIGSRLDIADAIQVFVLPGYTASSSKLLLRLLRRIGRAPDL